MVAGLLKLVFILCTIAVVDTLWFNAMPESNRYKNVQAFNVVTLWIVAIVLIIKLVTM
jgi:archaellum biogenesis protein FlaJ (TadC family)